MTVPEPTEIYRLTVTVEFETKSCIDQLRSEIETFCKNHGMKITANGVRTKYSHCWICGRPAWMQTFGVGECECRPSHYRSCEAWRLRGGWKPSGKETKEEVQ